MPKSDCLETEGVVTDVFPNATFKVKLQNGHIITCYISGKLRMNFIKILEGEYSEQTVQIIRTIHEPYLSYYLCKPHLRTPQQLEARNSPLQIYVYHQQCVNTFIIPKLTGNGRSCQNRYHFHESPATTFGTMKKSTTIQFVTMFVGSDITGSSHISLQK